MRKVDPSILGPAGRTGNEEKPRHAGPSGPYSYEPARRKRMIPASIMSAR